MDALNALYNISFKYSRQLPSACFGIRSSSRDATGSAEVRHSRSPSFKSAFPDGYWKWDTTSSSLVLFPRFGSQNGHLKKAAILQTTSQTTLAQESSEPCPPPPRLLLAELATSVRTPRTRPCLLLSSLMPFGTSGRTSEPPATTEISGVLHSTSSTLISKEISSVSSSMHGSNMDVSDAAGSSRPDTPQPDRVLRRARPRITRNSLQDSRSRTLSFASIALPYVESGDTSDSDSEPEFETAIDTFLSDCDSFSHYDESYSPSAQLQTSSYDYTDQLTIDLWHVHVLSPILESELEDSGPYD